MAAARPVLPKINEVIHKPIPAPVTVLQYGEGNFLRAFADYMIDAAVEQGVFNGGVFIVKPIEAGGLEDFRAQDCLYTVVLRGVQNGEPRRIQRAVTCIAGAADPYTEYETYAALAKSPDLRFIISNTTEAGIVYREEDRFTDTPPGSYPGKLTKFLYERYGAFGGAADKGLIVLPAELIEKNGTVLLDCCRRHAARWGLPPGFTDWLGRCNIFCNTLVDRIVTGYPRDEADALERELGYTDRYLTAGEPFALWVIESAEPETVARAFPLDKAGMPVLFTRDCAPYRERKVRLLNGAHTASALAAHGCGLETVGEMTRDPAVRPFLTRALYGELAPLTPLPEDEVKDFADAVLERFANPFIRHALLSIALNSVSKFKARILPTILETWAVKRTLPPELCFSLSALAAFYTGTGYPLRDDAFVLDFFRENRGLPARELMEVLLKRADFWGEDLSRIPGLCALTGDYLGSIREKGMRSALEGFLA